MLGISGVELVILLVFAFLLFGPDRLPAMGRTIGRALRQFRSAQERMNTMVRTEVVEPLNQVMVEPPKRQGPKKKITGTNASTKPETFAEKKARLAAESQETAQRRLAMASGEQPEEVFVVTSTYRPSGASETFAQRKARLDAEKAAAAEQKESGAATTAKSVTATNKTMAKKSTSSAAKLYGIDKDRIAAARAAAAQRNSGKEAQAEA